ncbi:MAG TPA: ATP-binding protein [Gemmatimonadales bacterium]|nr:ATP-binding protein [Gemmatimonadales bacterium]
MVPGPGERASRPNPSLRTELLLNLAVLAAGALVLAVLSAVLSPLLGRGFLGFALLTVLIAADVAIFLGFGRFLISRLVTAPMEALVEATQAVASGELSRRAPPGGTREFDHLAESVNQMTERLLDAQGALVRAEKLASVGRLAAGVAHEVGNPLAAVANYVELLRRRGVEPEIVAAIEREAGRIDIIVRSLLDYARPRDARRERVDLASVASRAVDLLRSQGVLRPVSVEVAPATGLPPVLGDAAALEQVFVNLLLNAVDAAGEGGRIAVVAAVARLGEPEAERRSSDQPEGVPTVPRLSRRSRRHLEGTADGSLAVQVVVADSGGGVPEELRDRIFDPFFTTKPPGKGTGLGLAIVQRIVQDHGGRVDVFAAREGGAAFAVTLPGLAS